jgi:hypothetical protein
LFPTVYLDYRVSDKYDISMSYGRRLRRPSYAHLNPFRYYTTPFSYSEGNPFLRPAYSHSFDITQQFNNKYSITLYYSHYTGEILQLPEQDPVTKTIAFRRLNLDKSFAWGITSEIPFSPVKWWQVFLSADVSMQGVKSAYLGGIIDYNKLTLDLSVNQSVTISEKKMWNAESVFSYRSPRYGGLFLLGNYSELTLGVKKTLKNKRVNIALNFSDMFRGTAFPAAVSYLNQKSTARTDNDLHGFRLSVSYKFGNLSNKQVKDKAIGNKDERNRIR